LDVEKRIFGTLLILHIGMMFWVIFSYLKYHLGARRRLLFGHFSVIFGSGFLD